MVALGTVPGRWSDCEGAAARSKRLYHLHWGGLCGVDRPTTAHSPSRILYYPAPPSNDTSNIDSIGHLILPLVVYGPDGLRSRFPRKPAVLVAGSGPPAQGSPPATGFQRRSCERLRCCDSRKCNAGVKLRYHYMHEQQTQKYIIILLQGIGGTARDLIYTAALDHEERGMTGAVGGVLRQLPGTLVKPIILASEATRHVLGGMKNQFVPDARREANEKWRTSDSAD